MNYDSFTLAYEQTQVKRILKAIEALQSRGVSPGREVPSDDALVIGSGRRLTMAVMFLDICGFSSRPSETENEQSSNLKALNIFFTEMVRIAEDYGGTLEKNTGDGLMVYFEDGTQATESGCKRSVSCGLTMLRTAGRIINPVLDAIGIHKIEFRLGIDHGPITIAKLGAARRFNALVAVGTAANVACKMLRFGGPGEIIIGDTVKQELSSGWHPFITPIAESSGWVYRSTGRSYPFYRYIGRWKT